MRVYVVWAFVVLFLAMAVGSVWADANLLANGDFEDPFINQPWAYIAPGSSIPGWTASGSGVVLNNTFGQPAAYSGVQSVELNYYGPAGLWQDIATTPGQTYELTFAMAGQYNTGPSTKGMEIRWENALAGTVTWDQYQSGGAWELHSLMLTATGPTARLEFWGLVEGDGGPYVDAASLNAVPEPSTFISLPVLLIGTVGLALRRRK